MSHFSVAVFSHTADEIDQLLEPFDECVEAGSPYAEFEEDLNGDLDENTGKRGYWHNPNAAYDYYVLGGRWRGLLKLREGATGERAAFDKYDAAFEYPAGRCDQARVADCDFSRDEAIYQLALRRWEILVEGAEPTDDEKKSILFLYKPEYYVNRYGSKERFAELQSCFLPYAFVSADGEWHGQGRMGWFGCDDATSESIAAFEKAFAEYLEKAKEENLMISIVDMHI